MFYSKLHWGLYGSAGILLDFTIYVCSYFCFLRYTCFSSFGHFLSMKIIRIWQFFGLEFWNEQVCLVSFRSWGVASFPFLFLLVGTWERNCPAKAPVWAPGSDLSRAAGDKLLLPPPRAQKEWRAGESTRQVSLIAGAAQSPNPGNFEPHLPAPLCCGGAGWSQISSKARVAGYCSA